ncbi:CoA pyrophosphatase [Longimicrobium sp.]|uniref:NUDIX hydrolase n=1 Tax=Longimicrobium sp. TaxID=2029185 RepID=UPI002C6F8CC6|nr:CoA pyrophosphatase [Longimicrobium sp.]HSU16265.1 CoA pyrophosphatase [Longimicrobium sp.]
MTDPRIQALEAALASHPPFRAPPDAASSRAAVALLLRVAGGGLELLLIRRAEREGDPWSGHMALPGGRHQAGDADMRATAARETLEEVAIDVAGGGRLLGELDELAPRSARIPSIVVSPFVFHVPSGAQAHPNHEVQEAVWVAVDELLHPGAATEYLHELAEGSTLAFPAFDARGYVVWGMTHRILTGFLELYAQAVTP